MPKKIKRGDPLASAGFVGYVKKVKNERGDPLETKKFSKKKSHNAEKKRKKIERGDLGGFRIVYKKWTDQCEDCSMKKKKQSLL